VIPLAGYGFKLPVFLAGDGADQIAKNTADMTLLICQDFGRIVIDTYTQGLGHCAHWRSTSQKDKAA